MNSDPLTTWPEERKHLLATRAGLREIRKNSVTGLIVGLYENEPAGLDADFDRWSTVCEEHGHIVSHRTLAMARYQMADPIGWCDTCYAEFAKYLPKEAK